MFSDFTKRIVKHSLIMTYIFAVLYLKIADTTNPFFGAVVPTVGFYLSTQTLNVIKKKWLSKK
jgi:hypothetical protein